MTPALSFLYYCYVYLTTTSMINHYCGNSNPNKTAASQMVRYHLGSIAYAAIWFPPAEIFRMVYNLFEPCIRETSKLPFLIVNNFEIDKAWYAKFTRTICCCNCFSKLGKKLLPLNIDGFILQYTVSKRIKESCLIADDLAKFEEKETQLDQLPCKYWKLVTMN